MRTGWAMALLAAGSAMQAGCTSVQTRRMGEAENTGIVYYLPKGLTTVQVIESRTPDRTVTQSLRLGATRFVPDTGQAYCMVHRPSAWMDDDVKVSLSPAGLLAKVEVKTEDRSDEVIVQIARAAAGIAPSALGAEAVLHSCALDLADARAVTEFNALLAKQYRGLSLAVDAGDTARPAPAVPPVAKGVYYRPVRPVKVTLAQDGRSAEHVVLLPNGGPVMLLPVTRNAFVKRVTRIEFDEGLLKTVLLSKPSEVLAAVSIPIEIAKAIVSIPAELVQLRINRSDSGKDAAQAEVNRLKVEEKLNTLREELHAGDDPMK